MTARMLKARLTWIARLIGRRTAKMSGELAGDLSGELAGARAVSVLRERPRTQWVKSRSGLRLSAFTLLELMIVVVILGILAAFVVPRIVGRPDEARVAKAKIEISSLEQALELYNLDTGMYPSTEQGLQALVQPPQSGEIPSNWKEGGYLMKKRVPPDPWGNPYVYVSPGIQNPDSFDLSSLGKDGREGGEGTAADISNWE
jgi:general secretion pathway protein G